MPRGLVWQGNTLTPRHRTDAELSRCPETSVDGYIRHDYHPISAPKYKDAGSSIGKMNKRVQQRQSWCVVRKLFIEYEIMWEHT